MAIGGLTGAGLFITGVVTATVVLASPKVITLNARVYYRDMIFYIGSLLILVFASFWGSINLFFSILFLIFYAIFIVIVALEDIL